MLNIEDRTFDEFYLSEEMRRALTSVGYTQPTRVQAEAIPLILAGVELTLQSQTGSGKTAAFAIPIIEMLEPKPGRIDVLVLTPTRELAKQVCKEFEGLGQFKELKATAIYGGTSYEAQYKELETASIVVATPGRLLDLCEKKRLDLSKLQILCLDEADEMLSMGFRDDIESVMEYLPEERQSILCSATITEEIKALAHKILFYPEFITLSAESVGTKDVTHYYYNVRGVGRPRDLLKLLEFEEPESALIFANTKHDTFTVTSFMKRHGYRAEVLNGDLPQKEREKTLLALRDGSIDYIVATDVAARGIDITDLSHVINYTLPDSAEVYIHRTGRTGRAGKKGKAISLIAPTEIATFFQVKKMYDVKLEEKTLPTSKEIMSVRQRRSLFELNDKISDMESIPYGGHLQLGEELLAGDKEIDKPIDRVKFIARLLALAEQVIDGEVERPLNGQIPAAAPPAPAAAAPAPQASTPKKEADPAKKKESTPSDTTSRRRRRASSSSKTAKRSSTRGRTAQKVEVVEVVEEEVAAVATTDSPSSTRKMYLNIGRNAFDSAKDLVDMLCYMSGMDPEDFGSINIESSYSFVHVRKTYFDDVIAALHGQEWEGNTISAEQARK